MLVHAAVSLRIEENTGWKEGRRDGREGRERVHISPQRGGEVNWRMMQNKNIEKLFSLYIDSFV